MFLYVYAENIGGGIVNSWVPKALIKVTEVQWVLRRVQRGKASPQPIRRFEAADHGILWYNETNSSKEKCVK